MIGESTYVWEVCSAFTVVRDYKLNLSLRESFRDNQYSDSE